MECSSKIEILLCGAVRTQIYQIHFKIEMWHWVKSPSGDSLRDATLRFMTVILFDSITSLSAIYIFADRDFISARMRMMLRIAKNGT